MQTSAKSIYIHLPFCKTKCPYCDFTSFAGKFEKDKNQYLQTLLNEIEQRGQVWIKKPPIIIETIFFGGGTPSIHSATELKSILDKLKEFFTWDQESVEITIECNPGTIDIAKLKEFQDIGINRISLGVQTFEPTLLHSLGRGHTVEDSISIIEAIKQCSFKSWSLDLIYGLAGQTLDICEQDISTAIKLQPKHISAYALSIESNTPFGKIYQNSSHPDLPYEDDVVRMYEKIDSNLRDNAFERYEISNWAQVGHRCKHNLTYWQALEYFAFGISAHGYINSYRYANSKDLQEYSNSPAKSSVEELIDPVEKIREEIILKLRLADGLELNSMVNTQLRVDKLDYFIKTGYLETLQNSNIRLTNRAMMVSNRIIRDLIK